MAFVDWAQPSPGACLAGGRADKGVGCGKIGFRGEQGCARLPSTGACCGELAAGNKVSKEGIRELYKGSRIEFISITVNVAHPICNNLAKVRVC